MDSSGTKHGEGDVQKIGLVQTRTSNDIFALQKWKELSLGLHDLMTLG